MTLKSSLSLIALTILISGCSLLGSKKVEIVSKPLEIDIMQPDLPRPLDLQTPKWYVVSEARIANPCKKVVQEDGSEKRPKQCDLSERENPDWPEGYTYLERFLDDMKDQNGGDVVFVASTVGDYKMMVANNQELRRYIRELGEVVIYYRNVTMPSGEKGIGVKVEKGENDK
jgi:hypothetical protein